ncbi:hypothetical protein G6F31_019175 [Rhizopus arrhizus]|nr:hypothetical protein G6F31_019175 [Rhizopus arrhizus]
MVLRDLNGSQMLASAGYNAGPRRPHNWRSTFTHPVEGAIFAETIPFNEPRTYRAIAVPEGTAGQYRADRRREHVDSMTRDPAIDGLQVYIVGGAVRDALLGLPPGDHDWVVVGATPEDMVRRGFIPVGGDFPVPAAATRGSRSTPAPT